MIRDRMTRSLGMATAALALALAAGPALAQSVSSYGTVAGYGGGYMKFGVLNPDAGADATDLQLDAGWIIHLFGETQALGDHVGVRFTGAFSQRPFDYEGAQRNTNTWLLDAALVLRPTGLSAYTAVSPFATLGGGVISHGFGTNGQAVVIEDANAVYPGDDQVAWQVSAGAGFDVLPGFSIGGTPVGIRVEVTDHLMLRSPFRSMSGESLGPVHNFRAGISLTGFGWL